MSLYQIYIQRSKVPHPRLPRGYDPTDARPTMFDAPTSGTTTGTADLSDDELDEVAGRLDAMRAAVADRPPDHAADRPRTTGEEPCDTAAHGPDREGDDRSDEPSAATNAENPADLLRTNRDSIMKSRSSKIVVTVAHQRNHRVETKGLEPSTPALQRRCSAS